METEDPLALYVEHLHARLRAREGRATAVTLPASIAELCSREPARCFDLILRALAEPVAPQVVAAIGDGLLEDLLNESAGRIADQVSAELRKNKKFRQAFGFGKHASVDPAVIEDWVAVLQSLGTTKEKERKSTWKR